MDTSLKQQLKDNGYTGEFDLSSLVEACGDGFKNLQRDSNHWAVNVGTSEHKEGSTPSEAVANLWLELNKHD